MIDMDLKDFIKKYKREINSADFLENFSMWIYDYLSIRDSLKLLILMCLRLNEPIEFCTGIGEKYSTLYFYIRNQDIYDFDGDLLIYDDSKKAVKDNLAAYLLKIAGLSTDHYAEVASLLKRIYI